MAAGLYYAQARYYRPEIGRFISADPWPADLTEPLTLNPYPYVTNNPMTYVDPLGLMKWCEVQGWISDGWNKVKGWWNDYQEWGYQQAYESACSFVKLTHPKVDLNSPEGQRLILEEMNKQEEIINSVGVGGIGRVGKVGKSLISKLLGKGAGNLAGKLIIEEGGQFTASEIRAATYMSQQGQNVILRSPIGTRAAGGTSDLLVDGIRYDVYTPTTTNVNRIISQMAKKNSQTSGIVLDLSQTSVTADQLGNALARVRGAGATNIKDIVIMP